MIPLNFLYPNTRGSHFIPEYYLGTHIPKAKRLFGDRWGQSHLISPDAQR